MTKYLIRPLWSAILFLLLIAPQCLKAETKISHLICDNTEKPLGIDSQHPAFSWQIESDSRDIIQEAYQIIVSDNNQEIINKTGNCWNTGKTNSRVTANIEYEGISLKSNTDYYWRVCVWIKGVPLWSKTEMFHTGFFEQTDWKAAWITAPEEITDGSPIFRKEFSVTKKVKSAFAFVSAAGLYECYFNGTKAGDHVLDPAITNYWKTILYSTYDIKPLLKKGKNIAGAMLGNGAYNMRRVDNRYSLDCKSLGNPCFIMQIIITYTDGTSDVIVTDSSWRYSMGPVVFNNFYGGEDYDARKEQPGWLSDSFYDAGWKNAITVKGPGGILKSQSMPPIKVVATLKPVAQTHDSSGVYLFDLGQNIAGWWSISIKGKPGTTIRVRGAETLNDSLFPKLLTKGDRISTKFDYHSKVWSDYSLKDDKQRTFRPYFFYSGFRYIEVRTSDKKDPESIQAEGLVVHSSLERAGCFTSSDSLLNKIYKAALWSQISNTEGYPTDCPHREKGAYCGDGQIIAESSMLNFRMSGFYRNWLNDMRDSQSDNGRIPNTSPELVGGIGGGVAWGSAYILIPWWMYQYYNDMIVLKEHYPEMKRYLYYLKALGTKDENPAEPYIINNFDGYWYSLGEWCAPGENDCPNHAVVNTFYYYYNSFIMSKIADLLGFNNDVAEFTALSDTIKAAFNRKFFDKNTYLYGTSECYQTYQILALYGNMVPEGFRDKVFKTLTDDIRHRGIHLNTGIIGTKYLWKVLAEGGENDLAFQVATQTTYPGYGYWINNGCTTLIEEWGGLHSHNHQMFGSVTEYFYKYLAGIQSPEEGVTTTGFHNFLLKPYIPSGLKSSKAELETNSGKIISDWKKGKDSFDYHISVPANSKATVVMPFPDEDNSTFSEERTILWQNGKTGKKVPGIHEIKTEKDKIVLFVGSGDYHFSLKKN